MQIVMNMPVWPYALCVYSHKARGESHDWGYCVKCMVWLARYEWQFFVAAKIILVSPEQVLSYMTLFTGCRNRPSARLSYVSLKRSRGCS